MKHALLCGGLLGALWGCAAAPADVRPLDRVVTPIPLRADRKDVMPLGEVSVFTIRWGILPVGRVEYRVSEVSSARGPLLELVALTRSSALASVFLSVSGTSRSLLDKASFLPLAMLWTTAEKDDPQVRSADFRQDQEWARSVKYTSEWMVRRIVKGPRIHDPVSAIFLARVMEIPAEGEEVRLLLVEGENVHLMTIRSAGTDVLSFEGREYPCARLSIRTDRIDDEGTFTDEEPWNSLFVWVAETPERPILKMSGKTRFARVSLVLTERRIRPDLPTPR